MISLFKTNIRIGIGGCEIRQSRSSVEKEGIPLTYLTCNCPLLND